MYDDNEFELTMGSALFFIQEAVSSPTFKERIVDPIMNSLQSPNVSKRYIEYGNMFMSANADMLAKEYPTREVSFPPKYVDDIMKLFGFTMDSLKKDLRESLNEVNDKTNFHSIMESPTNIIHTIVLSYSDITQNRRLRDSARQQLALTIWERMYGKYWKSSPVLNEGLMGYVYSQLNMTWDIVRAENMINWIMEITEGAYSLYRSRLDFDLSKVFKYNDNLVPRANKNQSIHFHGCFIFLLPLSSRSTLSFRRFIF